MIGDTATEHGSASPQAYTSVKSATQHGSSSWIIETATSGTTHLKICVGFAKPVIPGLVLRWPAQGKAEEPGSSTPAQRLSPNTPKQFWTISAAPTTKGGGSFTKHPRPAVAHMPKRFGDGDGHTGRTSGYEKPAGIDFCRFFHRLFSQFLQAFASFQDHTLGDFSRLLPIFHT